MAAKVRDVFADMVVFKDPGRYKYFSALGVPSYLRDWLVMRLADPDGTLDSDEVQAYVRQYMPGRDQWELLKSRMVNEGQPVRFLTKLRVELDVRTGEAFFSLPDFGFPSRRTDALVDSRLVSSKERQEELLGAAETWGVVELEWRFHSLQGRPAEGRVILVDFKPFRPYRVEVEFYQEARQEFTLTEWVDVLLMGIDYNPLAFLNLREKLTLLGRLLPFAERRLNLIELAPKGTGKSTVFSQISKHGWLVSGGSVGRVSLFYDKRRRIPGLVSRCDYVALDEVQSISFSDEDEVRGALKGYLESGEYRIADYRGLGEAGIVLLGNIDSQVMNDHAYMLSALPNAFQESALIDRFHGFIRGWHIPRMREDMKASGWGLNVEYLSEILHALRGDLRYRALVDERLHVPRGADTRDTEAIKRMSTAWLKLLFPHAPMAGAIASDTFERHCLGPARDMRGTIRRQLSLMDMEYTEALPDIQCA
ncbi:MAG: BREX system Lon protease-like protein BrxL [Anaerolineae bacterium]|nr:BREX system Lon protease-like protein BrxL [Anaerolineae bacterium]